MATRSGARGFEAEVALKVLHPHLASLEGARRMLFHEARVASLVRHPNVVHIEDFGEDEGHTYIEMELVDGAALCSLLGALAARGVSIPISLAVHLAREVALALHAAHEVEEADGTPAGIVHRDVSPKNILISKRGFVKLCDFGIAKARRGLVESGSVQIRGTLRYMAPEQIRRRSIDRRADTYALAIVLWEMISGHRYFDAPNELAMIDQVANPTPRPLSRACPEAAALGRVLNRALQPSPDRRFTTAIELHAELGDACPSAVKVEARELATFFAAAMAALDERRGPPRITQSVGPVRPDTVPRTAQVENTRPAAATRTLEEHLPSTASLRRSLLSASGSAPTPQRARRVSIRRSALLMLMTIAVLVGHGTSPAHPPAALQPLPPPPAAQTVSMDTGTVRARPEASSSVVASPSRTRTVSPRARRESSRASALARRRHRSSFDEAVRRCFARGDFDGAIRRLRHRADSPRRLAWLIAAHRARGAVDRALRLMRVFVARYPRDRRTAGFRAFLARH